MTLSLFDSQIYRSLLRDEEIAALFSDAAEIAALVSVEAALARAQAELGMIPESSAEAITELARKVKIDPASLAPGTGTAGIPIPALLEQLRKAMERPQDAQYLHFGATSQDIIDTALLLRLRGVCDIVDARLRLFLAALADLAEQHAELPMTARTRRQPATPTSFGAQVASWGLPLLNHLEVLAQLKPRLLRVSLFGASGNSTAFGEQAHNLRRRLASELKLEDSELSWHGDRSALAEFSALLTRINAALAKLAEDCMQGAQAEVAELTLAATGGSSTMPQKQNPVQAETLVSLFQLSLSLDSAMNQALLHRQQRDGAAWMLEWMTLPQICAASGRALQLATSLVTQLQPNAERMLANLEAANGLVYAEAISFRLAAEMPRPEAQALVKQLCGDATGKNCSLADLVAERYPNIDWKALANPGAQLGDAALQAKRFAARAR